MKKSYKIEKTKFKDIMMSFIINMDPLSIFINLLAKTEGRDKVMFNNKLVSQAYSVRDSEFQIPKGHIYCSI